jgi:LPXTG-site transpeptidase (sortase) family protein
MYWLDASLQQAEGNRELERLLTTEKAGIRPLERPAIPDGGLVGKVEIPRLQLSAIVFQGADDPELNEGVGHVEKSALPGQKGNVVLAGHRDSFFRGLRNIERGDTIRITSESGVSIYSVKATEIVEPTDVGVMAPTPDEEVTLITCYPFYFVGHAPKRFIVHGVREEMADAPESRVSLREARKPSPMAETQATRPRRRVRASETYVVPISADPVPVADVADSSQSAPQTWKNSWRHPILFAKQVFHRSPRDSAQ